MTKRFVSDSIGKRALVHTAVHQGFVCYGCEKPMPKKTQYVGATTYWGARVKTCLACWVAGQGRV